MRQKILLYIYCAILPNDSPSIVNFRFKSLADLWDGDTWQLWYFVKCSANWDMATGLFHRQWSGFIQWQVISLIRKIYKYNLCWLVILNYKLHLYSKIYQSLQLVHTGSSNVSYVVSSVQRQELGYIQRIGLDTVIISPVQKICIKFRTVFIHFHFLVVPSLPSVRVRRYLVVF